MKDKKIIDGKYIVEGRLGSGGEGVAFLVKDKDKKDTDTEPEYLVAKIIEYDEAHIESKDYPKDEEFQKKLKRKIDLFEKIKLIKHPYILECITSGKGSIEKNNIIKKKRNYFIFEYAPRGDLWKIIAITGGFGERCGKFIFKKILLGVQKLHSSGIYHRDLKVDNIFLDNDYNPKIGGFSFSCINANNLKEFVGNERYMAPEIILNKPYDGIKADIFSLGQLLFVLVTGRYGFQSAKHNDKLYQLIKLRDYSEYWNTVKEYLDKSEIPSANFKDLFFKMVSYEPEQRPSVEAILIDPWMQEINKLNNEKMNDLENEVRQEFYNREKTLKNKQILEVDDYFVRKYVSNK